MIGQTTSHYRIIDKLGGGGMGVVYKAEDTRLHRAVALKFLPEELCRDPQALERFQREAQAASALNHPNICTIYDIGEHEGRHFIAMECLEGVALNHRIQGKPLGTEEVIDLTIQITEGLAAAHAKGIIHRDIKPANIIVGPSGHVKILDFGLAKSAQAGSTAATTATRSIENPLTSPGTALGTIGYMSPEQALGKELDVRTDLFSLGVVLYEMATGTTPFKGDTSAATFDAILHKSPTAPVRLNPECPVELERIINRLLEKDRDLRYQHAADLRAELKRLKRDSGSKASAAYAAVEKPVERRSKTPYWVVAAAAIVAVCAGIWYFLRFFPREESLPPPKIVQVTSSPGSKDAPALSPDGNWIAFQWEGEKADNWDIYVKDLANPGEPTRLTTDPAPDVYPAWSPDGRQIAFWRASPNGDALCLISPLGGTERKIADALAIGPLSYSPDGKNIVFSDKVPATAPLSIWSINIGTLQKELLVKPASNNYIDTNAKYSPDGRSLAFIRRSGAVDYAIYVMRMPDGEPRLVTRFGTPMNLSWTSDGRELVFSSWENAGEVALWRIAMEGGEPRRIPVRGERVSLASAGRNRLAYVNETGNRDIWRMDLTGPQPVKAPGHPLLSWASNEGYVSIAPNSKKIAFQSDRSGTMEIWVCGIDGSNPKQITDMRAPNTGGASWSPDGKTIAFDSQKSGTNKVYLLSADGGQPHQLTDGPAEDGAASWSRDGRWIYFYSNRSGSSNIWKIPSAGGTVEQVTKDGGFSGWESADGRLLYYYSQKAGRKPGLYQVPVSGGPETLAFGGVSALLCFTDSGIYFTDVQPKPPILKFYDFAMKHTTTIAPLHDDPEFDAKVYSPRVSPDGKWIIYCGGIYHREIMLIDNFR